MDHDVGRIAGRLRQWREEAGLTLQSLARRSDVAASTIQKVETRQMVPTIAVLLKICRGLDRRPSELLQEGTEAVEVVHLVARERQVNSSELRKLSVEHLSANLFDPMLDVWRVVLNPHNGTGNEGIAFDGEQCIIVETGELQVRVDGKDYDLHTADTLHYKAHLPHTWSNWGDQPVRFLVISNRSRGLPASLRDELASSDDASD